MMTGLVIALVAVSAGLVAAVGGLVYFGREALTDADEIGDMKEMRATLRAAMVNTEAALDRAVGQLDVQRHRLEGVISDLKRDHAQELELFDEQLALCGDDESRGRAAVAGLRRLLQAGNPPPADPKADPND